MRLIVNADDFGLTENVSKGILYGMKHGCISSTSAIVSADDFKASAGLAMKEGITAMGLHSLLTVGKSILPAEEIPSLINEKGSFYSRKDFMGKEVDINEVRKELEAQIGVLLDTGLKLDHIDTHHGFMLKSREMFELFADLAAKYGVPLRNEVDHQKTAERDLYLSLLKEKGVRMTESMYFNHGTPHHTVDDVVAHLKEELNRHELIEIGCHAGYSDLKLRKLSILNDDREKELEVFTSKEVLDCIRENGIELISYGMI